MARRTILWLTPLVLAAGVGCKGRGGVVAPGAPPDPATVAASEPAPSAPAEWVAVFDVDEVDELDDETQELMPTAGTHLAVAPIGCWEGLSAALGDPTGDAVYVAAVVASSKQELEEVVAAVGRETLFEGELTAMCTD